MLISGLVLVNILAQVCFFRIDLTEDKRYSLSVATRDLMREQQAPVEVTLYLTGDLNAGFLRLQDATQELLAELEQYGELQYRTIDPLSLTQEEQSTLHQTLAQHGLYPTAIHERTANHKQSQTIAYPFAQIQVGTRSTFVALLQNNRGLSGAENLNHSIETLEYTFAEAIHTLTTERTRIAFLEGHAELPEQQTADIEQALSAYFDVYRGAITEDATCLAPFRALIIAAPQLPFSEADKYVLDQYVMHGGRILWLVNGVRFSESVLTDEGYTPAIPLDLNLTDLFFRYGVRINHRLVQDVQCLPIPVDVSSNPQQPQYQAMPWYYAPLLLTSQQHAITRNLMQVSATFASDIDFVGENDTQSREVLLATSQASRLIGTPNEVNLMDLHADLRAFTYSYIPVAVSISGTFPSLFAHRMKPEGIQDTRSILSTSEATKQVFVSSGSIIRNETQHGQPLPVGYDRYSKIQFGNRDFLVNTLLYLTDDNGLINLRQKSIPLRMLNEQRTQHHQITNQLLSTLLPLVLLGIVASITLYTRKKKYARL